MGVLNCNIEIGNVATLRGERRSGCEAREETARTIVGLLRHAIAPPEGAADAAPRPGGEVRARSPVSVDACGRLLCGVALQSTTSTSSINRATDALVVRISDCGRNGSEGRNRAAAAIGLEHIAVSQAWRGRGAACSTVHGARESVRAGKDGIDGDAMRCALEGQCKGHAGDQGAAPSLKIAAAVMLALRPPPPPSNAVVPPHLTPVIHFSPPLSHAALTDLLLLALVTDALLALRLGGV